MIGRDYHIQKIGSTPEQYQTSCPIVLSSHRRYRLILFLYSTSQSQGAQSLLTTKNMASHIKLSILPEHLDGSSRKVFQVQMRLLAPTWPVKVMTA